MQALGYIYPEFYLHLGRLIHFHPQAIPLKHSNQG